ncbi:unnamed protein product [Malus baccata var. baccata]
MHSFGYRANALLTFAVTILALMCAMASISDNLNHPTPTTQVQVLNINWLQKQLNGNDEVSMTMNISADLQSLFTWNTKQVFVFLAAEYGTRKNSLNQVSAHIFFKLYFWLVICFDFAFLEVKIEINNSSFSLNNCFSICFACMCPSDPHIHSIVSSRACRLHSALVIA